MNTGNYYPQYQDSIRLITKEDTFYVLLQNISQKIKKINYATCGNSLLDKLSFEVKDEKGEIFPIVCGEKAFLLHQGMQDAGESCEATMRMEYSLSPEESLIYPITLYSCAWENIPKNLVTYGSNVTAEKPLTMRAIFHWNGKQKIYSEWKKHTSAINPNYAKYKLY